jgi:hypothetical protein
MDASNDLLSAQSDEHPENNDSNLAYELAPAVQWFGKVEMHDPAPSC